MLTCIVKFPVTTELYAIYRPTLLIADAYFATVLIFVYETGKS